MYFSVSQTLFMVRRLNSTILAYNYKLKEVCYTLGFSISFHTISLFMLQTRLNRHLLIKICRRIVVILVLFSVVHFNS